METVPSCMTPLWDSSGHFRMVQNRLVEHQAVFEGPAQQLGVVDRPIRIGEADRTGPVQRADLGQFLAFAVLADAGQHKHMQLSARRA